MMGHRKHVDCMPQAKAIYQNECCFATAISSSLTFALSLSNLFSHM